MRILAIVAVVAGLSMIAGSQYSFPQYYERTIELFNIHSGGGTATSMVPSGWILDVSVRAEYPVELLVGYGYYLNGSFAYETYLRREVTDFQVSIVTPREASWDLTINNRIDRPHIATLSYSLTETSTQAMLLYGGAVTSVAGLALVLIIRFKSPKDGFSI